MSKQSEASHRIVFFGTPDFAVPGLEALLKQPDFEVTAVVCQPDRPAGRGQSQAACAVKRCAAAHNLPVFQPESIRKAKDEFIAQLNGLGPISAAVVIAYGQILPQAVLDLPAAGCINVHGSLLPRWRGAAPMQRAIMAGDKETGVCLMQMEAGLDTGPVYTREVVAIEETENIGTLHDKLARLGADMLSRDLSSIIRKEITPEPQPDDGVTYAPKISKEECCLDWGQSAGHVARVIRALAPFPGAYSTFRGKRVKIYAAKEKPESYGPAPGSIVRFDKNTLEVQCGDAPLALLELQAEGKRRMLVDEFMRGFEVSAGDKFDGCESK